MKKRRGGQPGNKNAEKTGKHSAWRKRLDALERKLRQQSARVIDNVDVTIEDEESKT